MLKIRVTIIPYLKLRIDYNIHTYQRSVGYAVISYSETCNHHLYDEIYYLWLIQ